MHKLIYSMTSSNRKKLSKDDRISILEEEIVHMKKKIKKLKKKINNR